MFSRCCAAIAPSRFVSGVRHAARSAKPIPGAFRQTVEVDGITVVTTEDDARRALEELERQKDRPHAWDTETVDVALGRGGQAQSPVSHGRVVCATCFCGDDADFGNGPRLLVDNVGPAAGLLERYFKDYFEDATYQKIFHNYSFDRHLLGHHGVRVRGLHADTLHLARLHDTSLASWEGSVRAQMVKEAGISSAMSLEAFTRSGPSTEGPAHVPTRAVRGVRLGGAALDQKVWSGAAALHTTAVPSQEALAAAKACPAPKRIGYGLKNLSAFFNITEGRQKSFPELFGVHETAALEVHDSPDRFPEWAKYATKDAVLTYQLFEKLKDELADRPWHTEVHEKPIGDLLRDDVVAQELRQGRRKLFSVSGTKSKKIERKTRSVGNPAGTNNSAQRDTGKTMWNFFEGYLRDFAECLADLEEAGVGVDLKLLKQIEERAEKDAEVHHKRFAEHFRSMKGANGELLNPDADLINIRSSPQLRMLLFGGTANRNDDSKQLEMARDFPLIKGSLPTPPKKRRFEIRSVGLEPVARKKDFSASGWPKTSKDVLDRLAGDPAQKKESLALTQLAERGLDPSEASKVSEGLQSLRVATKAKAMLTGFARPLQKHASHQSRIHPSWQFDTSTGRLACRSPNLQNLPALEKDAYGIRRAFRARPDHAFVIADYSQLELRVLAHVSNCASMIAKLQTGGDYHSEVAAEMFPHVQKAVREGTVVTTPDGDRPTVKSKFPLERTSAKAINFGIVYGMTPATLAEELGVEPADAEELMQAWMKTKPEVSRWQQAVRMESEATKRSLSLLGRWRSLPLLDAQASPAHRFRSLRAAVNFGIQGSAADIVLAAMLRLWRDQRLQELGFRLVMQVHDEFVLEGPEKHAEKAAEVVTEVMKYPFWEKNANFKFRLPLEVDVSIGSTLAAKA